MGCRPPGRGLAGPIYLYIQGPVKPAMSFRLQRAPEMLFAELLQKERGAFLM